MPGHSELAQIARLQAERLHRWCHLRRQPTTPDLAIRHAVHPVEAGSSGSAPALTPAALTQLVIDYLWAGQQRALTRGGTLAYYPGAPSIYGARNDAIEGVTRALPLWSAAVAADHSGSARSQAMQMHLRRALLNGCSPHHAGYWGDVDDYSTLICEAADVALALWLSRDWLWVGLDHAERAMVARWLGQSLGKRTADNNWHLFVVISDAVLAALVPGHEFGSHARLQRVIGFTRPDGCFVDGPQGRVDLYNAWGFHYALFWLGEIQPGLLPPAASASLGEFCAWYRYLFTRGGVPLWGRSLCYRMAVAAPLLAGALRGFATIDAMTAVDAYAASMGFFVARGALQQGRPTQGVFDEDLRWLDAYSGPASSLWGTRAMVLYLYGAPRFANLPLRPAVLPSEREAVDLRIEALGARLTTNPVIARATLHFDAAHPARADLPLSPQRMSDRLRQWVFARASRTGLNLLDVGHREFSSALEQYGRGPLNDRS